MSEQGEEELANAEWWKDVRYYRLYKAAAAGTDALLATAEEILQEGSHSREDVMGDLEGLARSYRTLAENTEAAVAHWKKESKKRHNPGLPEDRSSP